MITFLHFKIYFNPHNQHFVISQFEIILNLIVCKQLIYNLNSLYLIVLCCGNSVI